MRKLVFKTRGVKEIKKEIFIPSGNIITIDMSIMFSDIDSVVKSPLLTFKDLEIDSAIYGKLVTSNFIKYGKFNKDKIVVDFEVKLYNQEEVENYPFDRNNDILILWFKKYYKDICKARNIKKKFDIDLFIKNLVCKKVELNEKRKN